MATKRNATVCVIDGCKKLASGSHIRCGQHESQRSRELARSRPATRSCSLDDCGRPLYARSFCELHYGRFKRHGNPLQVADPSERRASEPTYRAVHLRLRAWRGPASGLVCVDCGDQAQDWSYIGGASDEKVDELRGLPYSADPAFYVARCRTCHRRHDWQPTHCVNGHEFSEQNTGFRANGSRRCRKCDVIRMTAGRKRRGVTR